MSRRNTYGKILMVLEIRRVSLGFILVRITHDHSHRADLSVHDRTIKINITKIKENPHTRTHESRVNYKSCCYYLIFFPILKSGRIVLFSKRTSTKRFGPAVRTIHGTAADPVTCTRGGDPSGCNVRLRQSKTGSRASADIRHAVITVCVRRK